MFILAAQVAFYYMAAASIASALLAVTRRNPVHSMLWVLSLFLHVAGIFVLLRAEFLAAVQIIVYAGAILVFYLFFLMLLDLPGEVAGPRFSSHWRLAAAGGFGFLAMIWLTRPEKVYVPGAANADGPLTTVSPGSISEVGRALFGTFALPFEMASLILLAAIIGAVMLVKSRTVS
jgi:NADH-quinone oxidoreductase subunit J